MRIVLLLLLFNKLSAQQLFFSLENLNKISSSVYDSLGSYNTLLIGELYGTNEAPIITNAFVDLYLNKGKKVILALELPMQEQSFVDAYLKSGDTSIFTKSRFFNSTKDGRTGRAMVNLIKQQIGKNNVSIYNYVNAKLNSTAREQDSLMAVNLIELRKKNPEHVIVVLAGNLHIRTKKGFKSGFETMGYYLNNAFSNKLLALSIRFQRGNSYEKKNGVPGIQSLEEDKSHYKFYLTREGYILVDPGFHELGYQGIIYLREASPSMPYLSN